MPVQCQCAALDLLAVVCTRGFAWHGLQLEADRFQMVPHSHHPTCAHPMPPDAASVCPTTRQRRMWVLCGLVGQYNSTTVM